MATIDAKWKVHTPNLLREVMSNDSTAVLKIPIAVLAELLAEVAERAIELDDDKLNELMLRLTLYSAADPESPDYNPKIVRRYGL